ncbi:MAG: hypothetical protein IJ279_06180 [Clostridia bacterium]|nr:hypothetical protein [Clostridia bacterium]
MKNKTNLYTGLFLIIGGLTIIILKILSPDPLFNKESDFPYILGIVFIAAGMIIGIKLLIDYKKEKTNKNGFFASVFQFAISIIGLSLSVYMIINGYINGHVEKRFIITSLFLVYLLIMGIQGIIDYKKNLHEGDKNDK